MVKKVFPTAFVGLVGIFFIAYGMLFFVVFTQSSMMSALLSGVFSFTYGVFMLFQLITRIKRSKLVSIKMVDYAGRAFVAIYILLSFDSGTISGLEWISIVVLIAVLHLVAASIVSSRVPLDPKYTFYG